MNGQYIGHLPADDPLHDFLGDLIRDQLRLGIGVRRYRVFRLNGRHEVYGYEEAHSHARIVCKFYGSRFKSDPGLAAIVARQEYDNLNTLRGYDLVGSPHHVVRPLGCCPDINCVLAVEHFAGEELTDVINRAARHQDSAGLFRCLSGLASFLSTQHRRTVNGDCINFDVECSYLDAVNDRLLEHGRISRSDLGELAWLRDLWRARPRMWRDRQVWLHGDATPRNFLFGAGMRVGAIDLERMRRGDRAFDIGLVASELQHSFMSATGRKSLAEPFISHFFREYSRCSVDPEAAFSRLTARTPFYMALNLLRIARNDYVSRSYGERLLRQAKRLLRVG